MNWLSYLTPITIWREITKRGTQIEVRELWGRRKLDLDGYPQSNWGYVRNWQAVLHSAQIAQLPARGKACVLGLGGGNLVQILSRIKPSWQLSFVELESEIVEVAKKYFGVGGTRRCRIIVADAKDYMIANTARNDLVIVDLYRGDDIPSFVTTPLFLQMIRRALKPGRIAIFNYASHNFVEQDFEKFEKRLRKVFGMFTKIVDWGHTFYIVYNSEYDNRKADYGIRNSADH